MSNSSPSQRVAVESIGMNGACCLMYSSEHGCLGSDQSGILNLSSKDVHLIEVSFVDHVVPGFIRFVPLRET